MKDTFYFSHDYNARNDPKMMRLRSKHGAEGIGLFWCIIEMIYEQGGQIDYDLDIIKFDTRAEGDILKSVIEDFDLFKIEGKTITSESVSRRLSHRDQKSDKTRKAVNSRWEKYRRNTDVSKSDTIKERKEKEIKGEDIEVRRENFKSTLTPFLEFYGKEMLNAFFHHWSEPSRENTMRFEDERYWSISKKLASWKKLEINGFGTTAPKRLKIAVDEV